MERSKKIFSEHSLKKGEYYVEEGEIAKKFGLKNGLKDVIAIFTVGTLAFKQITYTLAYVLVKAALPSLGQIGFIIVQDKVKN